jgi:acetyl esterase/lipase
MTTRPCDQVLTLWPEGPPTGRRDNPEQGFERGDPSGCMTRMLRNVGDPSLSLYRPASGKANGVGVIICPGGGWRILAWEHEGERVAAWLAELGYTALILKYRLLPTPPDPAAFIEAMAAMDGQVQRRLPAAEAPRCLDDIVRHDAITAARGWAAEDGRRALALVREQAAELGIDPTRIGMLGFSAGAFLTADVALDPGGAPLAFAAPIYGGDTSQGAVTAESPPLFSAVAQDDRLFFKMCETLYARWSDAERPAALHVFGSGGHGFGMAPRGLACDRWPALFADWLKDLGLG